MRNIQERDTDYKSARIDESAYERSIRAEAARREWNRLAEGRSSDEQAYRDALTLGRING